MYPIPASLGLDPWENYQSYGDGGYKKFVYLCRNGTDWYDGSILKADGLTIDRFCTASSFLEMGNVNAAACSFVLTEPPVDIASWAVGDEIEVQIDPDNRSTISTPSADVAKMGIFVIDSITERLGVYTIDCLDRMVYLDVEMDWTGFSTNYPITTVLSNIASQCGITLANSISGFPNATVGWYTNPTMTCRQVVSAIAEVIGANAYMDWDGELRFGWYEPAKDANNLAVLLDESIAVSRYTAPQYYSLNNYAIGSPDEPQTEITNGDEVTYRLIANPLVEGARDYISVDTIADAIKAARYTAVSSDPSYYQFNGGDYTVLPFPYIWPMDVLSTQTAYIPITHVTYKLNSNMVLASSVEPRVPQANTFTSPQQTIINNMQEATEEINRHFFYANATGAHITTVENDPDSGNNVLVDSNGLYVREDTDVLAEFTADGAVVGKADEARTVVGKDSVSIYADDTTRAVRIGIKTSVVSSDWETASWTGTINAGATKTMALGHTPTSDCLVSAIYSLNGERVVAQVLLESPGYQAEYGGFTYSISGSTLTYKNNNDENISFSMLMVYGDVAIETGGSFEFGTAADAVGADSVSMGSGNTSSGRASFATGFGTGAIADYAFAEGEETEASGRASHVEGRYCTAAATASHAEGLQSEAAAAAAHAQNAGTIAASWAQTAIGQYNVADSADTYALIIGNGADLNTRANALTVDWNGGVNMGDDLIFGDPSAAIPSIIKHVYGNTNGGAIIIRPGSPLVMGGGEYATNRYDLGDIPLTGTGSEDAYLGADRAVHIESNANTIANRKTWDFDGSGNITTPAGGLINGVDITKIGEDGGGIASGTSATLASGTSWVNVGSFSLTKGKWLVIATLAFASNATGRRSMCLSTTSTGQAGLGYQCYSTAQATNGAVSILHCSRVVNVAATTTYYMNAAQNSGSSLTVYPVVESTRIV